MANRLGRRAWLVCALVAALTACTEDAKDDGDAGDAERPDRGPGLVDMLVPDGALPPDGPPIDAATDARATDSGVDPDGEAPQDARVRPDMAPPTEVVDCASACARYGSCERLGELFGDEEACLATCERASFRGDPEDWFACLSVESCNLLQLCRPPRPPALTCDEVCTFAADCGADAGPDCAAACEAGGDNFVACGEPLFECQNDEFRACLARDVYASCDSACTAGVECNVVRAAECVPQCVDQLLSLDPLADVRVRERSLCVTQAGLDCMRVNDCFNPPELGDVGGPDPTEQAFCALWNPCDFFEDCRDVYSALRDFGPPGAVRCASDQLQRGCPFDDFFYEICFEGGGGPDPSAIACGRYCAARDICSVLEDGQDRAGCVQACNAATQGADPDALERLGSSINCGGAFTCPELTTCLDRGSPATQCAGHCGRLDACGLAGADCAAECEAVWPRDRQAAYRACVAIAGDDCDVVNGCVVAPSVPCPGYCAALAECGLSPGPSCIASCDDRHFAEPIPVALEVACVQSAPVCAGADFSAAQCLVNPEVGGRECANYCRATTECAEAPGESLGDCLTRCINGLGNADGLVMEAARACLSAAAVDAPCAALLACLPDAPPAVDCEAHCGRQDACRIPVDGCVAACDAAPDADAAGCAADALRAGAACGGVAACVGYVPEPASPDCAGLCDARVACDRAVDPYLCRRDCTPAGPEIPIQRACVEASLCPDIPACLDLGPDIDAPCGAICEHAVGCGLFPDAAACGAVCTGQAASPRAPADYFDRVQGCLDRAGEGADCDPAIADTCFNTAFCENKDDLIIAPVNGGQVRVDTTREQDDYQGSCGGSGPESVILITVARRSAVSLIVSVADYDTLIWLRSSCDDEDSQVACNDDFNGLRSGIEANLEPGLYFLYVDGFAGSSGTATVDIGIQPL